MKAYLENTTGKTSKFWEIELDGNFHAIRSGKVGSEGKKTRKNLKTPEKALIAFKRQIAKKMQAGYLDPQSKVAQLKFEQTAFNDTTFEHQGDVKQVHYLKSGDLILSSTATTFYLWTKEGVLLDSYAFGENQYFWGEIYFIEIPNSKKVLCYIKDTYRVNHLMMIDLSSEKFELERETKLELPVEGYYGDLDLDEEHIYLGYTNGFMLLDYEFNILKTIESPQEKDNSSGVAVNAQKGLIAFVRYVRNEKEPVVIIDLEGNVISEFASKAHGSSGMNLCFNAAGTRLYLASSSNYETKVELWNPVTGALEKSLINYSSSGHVLSFGLRADEKYLAIRVAGIDLILWNVEDETVEWVKANQALDCSFAFGLEGLMYQSFGNRLTPLNLEDGESLLELKGLSEACNQMYFDDNNRQLWLAGGKRVLCFDEEGNLSESLEATTFVLGTLEDKILVVRRGRAYAHNDYAWLDLNTKAETPFMCNVLKDVDYNEDFVLSTEGYFSQKKKATRMWSLTGKLLKEMKPKKDWNMRLLGKEKMVVFDGKKIELWELGANTAIFSNKTAHTKGIEKAQVHHSQAHFISVAGAEMNFWKDDSGAPASFEVLTGAIVAVISRPSLAEYLLVTNNGFIYSFNPKNQALCLLIQTNVNVTQACFSNTGLLYVTTVKMEVLKLDLSAYIKVEVVETTPAKAATLDLSILTTNPSETELITFIEKLATSQLSEENFLDIREFLEHYTQEKGITTVHQAFTKMMMAQGALLKHQFAHEEEISSYAMSPDGNYLTLGTWVGDNYEEDGTLQIWELKTGRCINLLKERYGGIGWPDYPNNIQWSPNSQFLGTALNTNSVSKFNPFSASSSPLTDACVTNGWSRPPAWCWLGNTSNIVVSAWHNSEIPACICRGNQLRTYEDDAKWFAKKLKPEHKKLLGDNDLQPYTWCHATLDGAYIYGFNRHSHVYAIDVAKKQLAWLKITSKPIGFGNQEDFFVYNEGAQLVLADLKTGEAKDYIRADFDAEGFEFANTKQRFALYKDKKVKVYDYKKEIADFELPQSLKGQYMSDSELRSLRFNVAGTAIACLLEDGTIVIYDIDAKQFTLEKAYSSVAQGIYWGENLAAVSSDFVEFITLNSDFSEAARLHLYDKKQQVEAYNALYGEVDSPLKVKKQDFTNLFDNQPLYPVSIEGKAEWLLAIENDVVVTSCENVALLDQHLSYTWNEKYAWPFSWGATSLYPTMEAAVNDPKLPFSDKERTLFKTAKKAKKKKGIEFKKGGSILDIIKLHQQSVKELDRGWASHLSDHNEIISKRLVQLGKYKMALKIADQTPEWYRKISNLSFIACELFQKAQKDLAKEAYEKALVLLEASTSDIKDWSMTFIYGPVGAATQLLVDKTSAATYFEKAYVKIEEGSNPFQKQLHLAISYLYCNELEKAMEVMKDGPWSSYFSQFQEQFVARLIRSNHFDLAVEYFDFAVGKCGNISSFDLLDQGVDYLIARKEYDAANQWIEKFPTLSTTHCKSRLTAALAGKTESDSESVLNEKNDSDVVELENAYAIFKKQTPKDRKYGMRDFVFKVAAKGFWKNAVELLKTIPAKDLNDRHNSCMKIIKEL